MTGTQIERKKISSDPAPELNHMTFNIRELERFSFIILELFQERGRKALIHVIDSTELPTGKASH